MNFNKHDVITIHADLAAARERVHKLIGVKELDASHKLDEMNHLWLPEKLAVSRKINGFNRIEVLDER